MKLKKLIPNPIKIGGVVYGAEIIEVGTLNEISKLKLDNLIANGSVKVIENDDNQDKKTERKELISLAKEMGLEFAKNIKTEDLQELIEQNKQN